MTSDQDPRIFLDDEALIIETSGEMPEVAYHASIHYLTNDPDGPGLRLDEAALRRLRNAAIEGFRRIILRDVNLKNRGKGAYRGIRRAIINWRRLNTFCQRHGLECGAVKDELRRAVIGFLRGEISDVREGKACCLNCGRRELLDFLDEIGVPPGDLPPGWECLPLEG